MAGIWTAERRANQAKRTRALQPWRCIRRIHTPAWAAHLQTICKKVEGFYSLAAAEDRKRLREALRECEGLLKASK